MTVANSRTPVVQTHILHPWFWGAIGSRSRGREARTAAGMGLLSTSVSFIPWGHSDRSVKRQVYLKYIQIAITEREKIFAKGRLTRA